MIAFAQAAEDESAGEDLGGEVEKIADDEEEGESSGAGQKRKVWGLLFSFASTLIPFAAPSFQSLFQATLKGLEACQAIFFQGTRAR